MIHQIANEKKTFRGRETIMSHKPNHRWRARPDRHQLYRWASLTAFKCLTGVGPVLCFSLIAFFGNAVFGATLEKSVKKKPVMGYVVTAASNYAGTLKCWISPDGFKVDSDRLGFIWLLRGPKWNALMYNQSSKKFVDLPYDSWKNKTLFAPISKNKLQLRMVKTRETEKMNGEVATHFVVMAKPKTASAAARVAALSGKTLSNASKEFKEAEMWVARDIAVPVQFSELMSKLFGIPQEKGLPLKIACRQRSGKITQIWETVSLTTAQLTPSSFDPLPGYKQVKDEMALMLDEEGLAPPGAEP